MRVQVAFTPDEAAAAPVGVVVDVVWHLDDRPGARSGYRRVLCSAEIDEAPALRDAVGDALVGGERNAVQVEGFDLGASPRRDS